MKSDIFSFGKSQAAQHAEDQVITVAEEPRRPVAFYDENGKAQHTFKYRDEESDAGYESEPVPQLAHLDIKKQQLFKPTRKLINKYQGKRKRL